MKSNDLQQLQRDADRKRKYDIILLYCSTKQERSFLVPYDCSVPPF